MNACPHCGTSLGPRYCRDHCSVCGLDIPQTPDQAEIDRLRTAMCQIDDLTCFDWSGMPEAAKAESHRQVRLVVLDALNHF